MTNISIGRYYPGNSILHLVDPRLKIIFTMVLMIVAFMVSEVFAIILLTLGTCTLILLSGVPFKEIASSLKPVLFILLFAFIINIFTGQGDILWQWWKLKITYQGLYAAFKMAFRLIILITNTSLLMTLTTTPILLADATESLLGPLKKVNFPVHEIAMMMSIALRFIPTLLEETDIIIKAQSSRGADYDTGGLIKKAKGMVSILIPLFVSSFKRADDLAVAMEARGYKGGVGRTKLRVLRYKKRDYLFLLGMVIFSAAVLILQFLL